MRKSGFGSAGIALIDFLQKMTAITDGSVIITVFITLEKETSHWSAGVSMRSTKCIHSTHTGFIIAITKHIYKFICRIVITYGNHWIQITVQCISTISFGERFIIFVNSTHNKKFDQTGSLHGLIVNHTFCIFHKVAYIYGPGAIVLRKERFNLREKTVQTFVSGRLRRMGRRNSPFFLYILWRINGGICFRIIWGFQLIVQTT